jgi:hypothetical protein
MNDMNMQSMKVCMIAGGIFSLVILVSVVVQTVLQSKILRELRRIGHKPEA